jgi:7-cyano-7-deazaguanine synthase
MSKKKAVVLLSGGVDSTTTLAIALRESFDVYALTFRYGQRNAIEIEAACRVAQALGTVEHMLVNFDLRQFAGSALTSDLEVPKDRPIVSMAESIPVTYVPARNTIFLSFALAWAEVLGAATIFIGVNALDYSGYPDCRPEYLRAYEQMARLATRAAVEGQQEMAIQAPLLHLSKAEIIRRGLDLEVNYGLTFTCYDPSPDGRACAHCDACRLRIGAFAANGMRDPAPYQEANFEAST